MSLEDLGNIGEFVAAVAVIVSLIYLALQIRQNTRSVRSATHHSAARAATETQNIYAQSGEVSRIFRIGAHAPEDLTEDERVQFDSMMRSIFMWYEDAFFQYRGSMLDDEVWEGRQRALLDHLKRPGVAWWWERHSEFFARSFASHAHQIAGKLRSQAKNGKPSADSSGLRHPASGGKM
jgi:hypothetical protein